MQSKWMMGLAAVATVALSGCFGTQCNNMLDATDKFIEKVRPCLQAGQTTTRFNVSQCETSIDKCTSAELEAVGKYADCLRNLPNCTPGTVQAFDAALTACNASVSAQIGQNCAVALSN
jgi:hypothetical protein